MKKHGERKHSKFSASGAERWLNCSASVALSEGLPDKPTEWSLEGTHAHEVLEAILKFKLKASTEETAQVLAGAPIAMFKIVDKSAKWLLKKKAENPLADFMVETRIHLSFIHEEMFGTFDSAILDYFGTLHIYDFKYGKHYVSPNKNLQMLFYAIGVAYKHHWNFKRVRLWIDQPRIPNYDAPLYWEIGIMELKKYVPMFQRGVDKIESGKTEYVEGAWCFFCKANKICPLKTVMKKKNVLAAFGLTHI